MPKTCFLFNLRGQEHTALFAIKKIMCSKISEFPRLLSHVCTKGSFQMWSLLNSALQVLSTLYCTGNAALHYYWFVLLNTWICLLKTSLQLQRSSIPWQKVEFPCFLQPDNGHPSSSQLTCIISKPDCRWKNKDMSIIPHLGTLLLLCFLLSLFPHLLLLHPLLG